MFAQSHQQSALLDQGITPLKRDLEALNAQIQQLSIREILARINTSTSLKHNHQAYLSMMRIGDGQEYVGVEAVKNWYARNMRIFVNLTRLPTFPQDRILVVYGSGHIPLLRQFLSDSTLYTLEDANIYLEEQKAES